MEAGLCMKCWWPLDDHDWKDGQPQCRNLKRARPAYRADKNAPKPTAEPGDGSLPPDDGLAFA